MYLAGLFLLVSNVRFWASIFVIERRSDGTQVERRRRRRRGVFGLEEVLRRVAKASRKSDLNLARGGDSNSFCLFFPAQGRICPRLYLVQLNV